MEHGDRVKVTVMFRGRELGFVERGRQLLDRIAKDVEYIGSVEKLPSKEGRMMMMTIISLGKGKKSNAKDKDQ